MLYPERVELGHERSGRTRGGKQRVDEDRAEDEADARALAEETRGSMGVLLRVAPWFGWLMLMWIVYTTSKGTRRLFTSIAPLSRSRQGQ